jgi:integrase
VRLRHYSRRTEKAYVDWIRRYIVFHQKKHPSAMVATEIVAFLSWLAVDRRVSASTQNRALSALVFLYSQVLGLDIGPIEHVPRARMPGKLPVVLSREEIGRLITHVDGMMWLIVALLYGTGLRLEECVGLRVKDLDFDRHQIVGSTLSFSPARICGPACGHQRGSACWSHQARELPHVSSQLRNPSARRRLRHPDGAGTTR